MFTTQQVDRLRGLCVIVLMALVLSGCGPGQPAPADAESEEAAPASSEASESLMYFAGTAEDLLNREYEEKYGGETGFLGPPKTEIQRSTRDDVYRVYENGLLYVHDFHVAAIHGQIAEKYILSGAETGKLGYPRSDVGKGPPGGQAAAFEHGVIFLADEAELAHVIYGPGWQKLRKSDDEYTVNMQLWEALGGYPLTDVTSMGDGIGYYVEFPNGAIYWQEHKYFAVYGPTVVTGSMYAKYQGLNRTAQIGAFDLGYPITDAYERPDGEGREQEFENGFLVWHPNTGAHSIYGSNYHSWTSEQPSEDGCLGYPTTDQFVVPGTTDLYRSVFIEGEIDSSPEETTLSYFLYLDSETCWSIPAGNSGSFTIRRSCGLPESVILKLSTQSPYISLPDEVWIEEDEKETVVRFDTSDNGTGKISIDVEALTNKSSDSRYKPTSATYQFPIGPETRSPVDFTFDNIRDVKTGLLDLIGTRANAHEPDDRPHADRIQETLDEGGTVVHQYNLPAMRVIISVDAAPGLYANRVYGVEDACDFSIPAYIKPISSFTVDDIAYIESLGGKVEEPMAGYGYGPTLEVRLPDDAIPILRNHPQVEYIEPSLVRGIRLP